MFINCVNEVVNMIAFFRSVLQELVRFGKNGQNGVNVVRHAANPSKEYQEGNVLVEM